MVSRTNSKISNSERRELILRSLRGERVGDLAAEYGLARSWVYDALRRAKKHPGEDLIEAEADAEFWREVVEILDD